MKADPVTQFEAIAEARGGGKPRHGARGVTVRIRCSGPGHDDRHASCDMTLTPGGRLLFYCQSRHCSFDEITSGLSADGLWSAEGQPSRPIADPFPASAFHQPTVAPCCLEGPPHRCGHWQAFNRFWLLGELHRNLHEACCELGEKFERAGKPVTAAALRAGIEFAIPFGAIVPAAVDNAIVAKAVDLVAAEFITTRRQAAA